MFHSLFLSLGLLSAPAPYAEVLSDYARIEQSLNKCPIDSATGGDLIDLAYYRDYLWPRQIAAFSSLTHENH